MAKATRPVLFEFKYTNTTKPAGPVVVVVPSPVQRVRSSNSSSSTTTDKVNNNNNIVLQPRLCTLRSYGSSDPVGKKLQRNNNLGNSDDNNSKVYVSQFYGRLSEYIESSKKTQDFEIISGRLAMVIFAATLAIEAATGDSIFKKTDTQGIAEAIGACLGAITFAAVFAWFSSARNKVGTIFNLSCNSFIDSFIDQIVDGLFYESELSDWIDDM